MVQLNKQKLIVALGLSLILAGCKKGSSGTCSKSPLVGTWDQDGGTDQMVFTGSCGGTSSDCDSTFTWPNVTASSGNVLVTITSTSGAGGCLPLGDNTCSYAIVGNALAVDCGGGEVDYTKQ